MFSCEKHLFYRTPRGDCFWIFQSFWEHLLSKIPLSYFFNFLQKLSHLLLHVSTYCIYFKRFVYITSSAHAFPHSLMKNTHDLKACVYYENSGFHQIFIFSPNDSPSKTMKNAFYFIQKALLVLKIFKFLYFCSSLFFCLSAIALEDKS